MKRAERPLYPLRHTKDEDRAPADDALAFECRTAATSIDFVSVIARVAWHLTQ
jgi:hypothetical protein